MQTPSNSQKCVWCGSVSPADARVCSRCGAILSGGHTSSDSAPHVLEDATDAAIDPRNNEKNARDAVPALQLKNETIRSTRRCAWCGSENLATETACKDCGAALTGSLSSPGSGAPKSDSLPSSTTNDPGAGGLRHNVRGRSRYWRSRTHRQRYDPQMHDSQWKLKRHLGHE
jgi:hypothetical protein